MAVRKTPARPFPYGEVPAGADLSHIVERLRELAVPLSALNHDPDNARSHDARNVGAIAESFRRFGQDQPLVVQREGMIVRKGNGRLEAATLLGWEHVAVVVVDDSDAEAVERALADNRSSELASWDVPVLMRLLSSLADAGTSSDSVGWTAEELRSLSAAAPGAAGGSESGKRENVVSKPAVLIECNSDSEQLELLERLTAEGLSVRSLWV